jgi:hypothetical protein
MHVDLGKIVFNTIHSLWLICTQITLPLIVHSYTLLLSGNSEVHRFFISGILPLELHQILLIEEMRKGTIN